MESFLHRDLTVYLPNHNLNYTDKMGMAVGLEARVPLLDQALLNLVPSMPSAWKVRGAATKRILRDAARGLVPDGIINRPKAGFGAPYRKWMRYDLAEMWSDLTTVDAVRQRGWFDPTGLQRVREVSQSGRQDLYMLQWSVLTVELWAREFLDRSPIGDRA
jgi:asparagine synthase (glutamine-hydrolysing)